MSMNSFNVTVPFTIAEALATKRLMEESQQRLIEPTSMSISDLEHRDKVASALCTLEGAILNAETEKECS